MHLRRALALLLTFPFVLPALAPSRAAAQETAVPPPPPAGYAAATTVALDDVLMPLLAAAERDAAEGRPGLAMTRAQMVLEAVPPSSTLRVRAEGVRLVAQQALGATPVEPVAPELLVEPSVAQAELDLQRGMYALAIARVDFALARVPGGSALAQRALAVRAGASRGMIAATQPVQPVQSVPPPGTVVPYGVPVAAAETPPEPPSDPTRRGDGEAVELYITAAVYGVYLGFWIPYASGLESGGTSGSEENLVYSLAMLGGGGLMALAVAGLDSGEGLRTGVAPSISVGIRYGLGMGFLMWGALDPFLSPLSSTVCGPVDCVTTDGRGGMTERTAMPMAFGLGGALIGAAIGYGGSPTVDHVRFVETGGLMGATLGLLVAVAAAQDSAQGFGITAGGLALGLVTNATLAASGIEISARRAWLLTLGFAIGAAAGTIVPAIAFASTGDFDVRVLGAVSAATSIAGLVGAILLTDGFDDRNRARSASAGFDPMRDLQIGASPLEGGGMVTVNGRL